jgi:hypothetical protein
MNSGSDIAPDLIPFIKPRSVLMMTVAQAQPQEVWVSKIQGTLAVSAIVQLGHAIQEVPPLSAEPDSFEWKLASSGRYSAKSAYQGFFLEAVQAEYADVIWRSWPPFKEKLFLWLTIRNSFDGGQTTKERIWASTMFALRSAHRDHRQPYGPMPNC